MFPNEQFSPERAQQLYAMYFDELQYASETGFDGVMVNEHHNNPLSMMPSVNVIGASVAQRNRKGKIVFLGNVLPIHDNPLRVAEEVAMIDILSGGRVVCGLTYAASARRAWPPTSTPWTTASASTRRAT